MDELEIEFINDDKKRHIVYLLDKTKIIAIYDSKKDELTIKNVSKDNVFLFEQKELKEVFINLIREERQKLN